MQIFNVQISMTHVNFNHLNTEFLQNRMLDIQFRKKLFNLKLPTSETDKTPMRKFQCANFFILFIWLSEKQLNNLTFPMVSSKVWITTKVIQLIITNSNSKIQIQKLKFNNLNSKIRFQKFKLQNLNSKNGILNFRIETSNLKILIQQSKSKNSISKIAIRKFNFKFNLHVFLIQSCWHVEYLF